ncbi:MAG TPA: hypothetical protein VFI22_06120 [Thermomicrobiales bacterium]|nr:hypothetical protein [Thermomicrobiales bacterium]
MAAHSFDDLTRKLGSAATRRRTLQGLGGVALGSLGVLGLGQAADAKSCKKRCKKHCNDNQSNRKCRNKCQRKCKK